MDDRSGQDLSLVQEILEGSLDAWHQFIHRYSGLILSVLRRRIHDEDDVRDVYVDVLARLREGRLASFEGRSALSTWLVIVARNMANDHLRRRFGRKALPKSLRDLDRRSREVFRLYYIEGLGFRAVRHWIGGDAGPLRPEELIGILRHIDSRLEDHTLRRLEYDLAAASQGGLTGRELELLEVLREEESEAQESGSPERRFMREEALRMAAEVRLALRELPQDEQRVLLMRFDQAWTGRKIAQEAGLSGEQRAFTLIRRAIRNLKARLDSMAGADVPRSPKNELPLRTGRRVSRAQNDPPETVDGT